MTVDSLKDAGIALDSLETLVHAASIRYMDTAVAVVVAAVAAVDAAAVTALNASAVDTACKKGNDLCDKEFYCDAEHELDHYRNDTYETAE